MKTKLLSLLAGVACIAALTTSCIKETSGSGDDGTPTLGEGEGYISIIIQDVSTKAPGDLVENPGTADESNLDSMRIVLYEKGHPDSPPKMHGTSCRPT